MGAIHVANRSPCVSGDVAKLSKSPLGQMAYWPRRDTLATWITHVANVSATWRESLWPSCDVDYRPCCNNWPCGSDHITTVGNVTHNHVAISAWSTSATWYISHMAKFCHMAYKIYPFFIYLFFLKKNWLNTFSFSKYHQNIRTTFEIYHKQYCNNSESKTTIN
jgi:hypothetical protein